jgi:hypothetical protein
MDQKIIDATSKKIYRKFPFLKDKSPRVSKQGDGRYLMIFSGSGDTPDGKKIQQTIRVVVTEDGRIIKTSMSR